MRSPNVILNDLACVSTATIGSALELSTNSSHVTEFQAGMMRIPHNECSAQL